MGGGGSLFHWRLYHIRGGGGGGSLSSTGDCTTSVGGSLPQVPLETVPNPRELPSVKHPQQSFNGRPEDTLNR